MKDVALTEVINHVYLNQLKKYNAQLSANVSVTETEV